MSAGAKALVIILAALSAQVHLIASSEFCTDCTSSQELQQPTAEIGESLLQVRSGHAAVSKAVKAKDLLPEELYELGVQVFHDEAGLDKAVEESMEMEINYAGVPLTLRILNKDNAAKRYGEETEDGQSYGLDTLLDARESQDDMVNMIDMGGNYGAVSIAVYNKFPGLLRTVVVEPVAATYFFLRWNLWLNKVPIFATKEDFVKDTQRPGVVALYGGVPVTGDEELLICVHPEWSMNAIAVAKFDAGWGCDCRFMNCTKVPKYPMDTFLDGFFGDSTVTLMKMDCEGCETGVLPELAKNPSRVKRLVGELHMPEEQLIDTACQYDNGQYMTKVCMYKEDGMTLGFQPGKIGIDHDEYGRVDEVAEGSQAQEKGVQKGWKMTGLDDAAWTKELIQEKAAGEKEFQISFSKDEWASSLPLGCNEERKKCKQ